MNMFQWMDDLTSRFQNSDIWSSQLLLFAKYPDSQNY